MLAIGRALMTAPRLLLLDEPSLGLSPLLTAELLRSIRAIGASGTAILLAEQNVAQALAICDRAYVLETGRIVAAGAAAELARSPALRRAFLGVASGG
jgi:branched-chain amino acid transport system ATP-binding protein